MKVVRLSSEMGKPFAGMIISGNLHVYFIFYRCRMLPLKFVQNIVGRV